MVERYLTVFPWRDLFCLQIDCFLDLEHWFVGFDIGMRVWNSRYAGPRAVALDFEAMDKWVAARTGKGGARGTGSEEGDWETWKEAGVWKALLDLALYRPESLEDIYLIESAGISVPSEEQQQDAISFQTRDGYFAWAYDSPARCTELAKLLNSALSDLAVLHPLDTELYCALAYHRP